MKSGVRRKVRGKVWLVGAGPGSADLLTVRAARVLAGAEVVAYDELVSEEVLALAPPDAERIAVGRRALGDGADAPRGCRHHEARIHPAVIERALAGRNVVRLKGGDPYVFGRGGEEAEELAAARIPFEVVPGISAALGAAASTHIPLTHREVSAHVTLATAHSARAEEDAAELAHRLPTSGTLVLYMGLGKLEATLAALVSAGRAPETPAAVISRATLPDERVVTGTLSDLAPRARAAGVAAPAIVIVGEVVARRVQAEAPWQGELRVAARMGRT